MLKACAKSKKDVMRSILNNYLLLETSLNNRLEQDFEWTVTPAGSSTASYLFSPNSTDKFDRCYEVLGASTACRLSTIRFMEVQEIWSKHNKAYGELRARYERERMNRRGQSRTLFPTLAAWAPKEDPLTAEQRAWTNMDQGVQVSTALTH